jgi:hypothetical protein
MKASVNVDRYFSDGEIAVESDINDSIRIRTILVWHR